MAIDATQLVVVGVVILVVLVVLVYLLGRVFGRGMKAGRQSEKVQYLSWLAPTPILALMRDTFHVTLKFL